MSKVILVFGASGTIGLGLIKVCLESTAVLKVVGVFRSSASAEKTAAVLGNPPDKFVSIVGDVASEKNAQDLMKLVQSQAGEITDVVASIGGLGPTGPILSQSFEQLAEFAITQKLSPHFIAAKTFLSAIADKPGTSYTIINGAGAHLIVPNNGNLTIASGTLATLSQVILYEYKERDVRVNEILIACFVEPWDSVGPNAISNVVMGRSILGIILKPAARSLCMMVSADNLVQLANTGITDKLNPNLEVLSIQI